MGSPVRPSLVGAEPPASRGNNAIMGSLEEYLLNALFQTEHAGVSPTRMTNESPRRVRRASHGIIHPIPDAEAKRTRRSVERRTTSLRCQGLPRVHRCGTACCVVPKREGRLLAGSAERRRPVSPERQHQDFGALPDRERSRGGAAGSRRFFRRRCAHR